MPRSAGTKFVGVREFKENLTGLLGKKGEVVVTRHGKPIARVVPVKKGSPEDLLLEIGMVLKVYLSPDVVAEIGETIVRLSPKLGEERAKVLSSLWMRFQSLCRMTEPERRVSICRDPKDDAYLSLCAGAGADYPITGDKDLFAVDPGKESGLPGDLKILTPREFLEAG